MARVGQAKLILSVKMEPSRSRWDRVELSSFFWSMMGSMSERKEEGLRMAGGNRSVESQCGITATRRRRYILGNFHWCLKSLQMI